MTFLIDIFNLSKSKQPCVAPDVVLNLDGTDWSRLVNMRLHQDNVSHVKNLLSMLHSDGYAFRRCRAQNCKGLIHWFWCGVEEYDPLRTATDLRPFLTHVRLDAVRQTNSLDSAESAWKEGQDHLKDEPTRELDQAQEGFWVEQYDPARRVKRSRKAGS